MPTLLILIVFFLSGSAGLIYESSWNRQIGLYLGNTSQSSSIVLCCYFFGMAFGYQLGKKWPERISSLKGYALCEIGIGIYAFLVPFLLKTNLEFFSSVTTNDLFWKSPINCLVVFFTLLPATLLLGATLPLMARIPKEIAPQGSTKGSFISFAYGINTLGAFLGLLLSSYIFFLLVGVKGSSYLAAGISITAGLIAMAVKIVFAAQTNTESDQRNSQQVSKSVPLAAKWICGTVGFIALSLEVLYLRLFSFIFHNSTYTFGLVLAVFLLALAAASMIVSRIPERKLKVALGFSSIGSAVSIPLSVFLFYQLTGFEYFSYGETFITHILYAFGLVAAVVFPVVTLSGMTLPLVWRILINQSCSDSQVVSSCTFWNSLLAGVGAIFANFILFPVFDLFPSFMMLAILSATILLWMPSIFPGTARKRLLSPAAITFAFILALNLTSGFYQHFHFVDFQSSTKLIKQRWKSAYGWIDLIQDRKGNLQVRQNLHYRHGSTGNSWTRQRRQAQLPLALHDDPQKTLFLGIGTGVTASGALTDRRVQSIEIVELIPEVVEAVKNIGAKNLNVLADKKTAIHCNDARHFLTTTPDNYDVIVSDLFVPWESQTGYLYTKEHYRTVAKKLKPCGHFFQCLAVYQLGPEQLTTILDTVKSEFRHVSIWWVYLSSGRPMIGVLASQEPLTLDLQKMKKRLGERDPQFEPDPYLADVDSLLSCYLGDWKKSRQEILNTDEYPVIEFTNPMAFGDNLLLSNKSWFEYYLQNLHRLKSQGSVRVKNGSIEFGQFKEIHKLVIEDGRSWN